MAEIFGRTQHMLLSVWGRRWRDVLIVPFTVYIDDSGTSPSQSVAIAAGLIVPAKRVPKLEDEWNTFKKKEGFTDLHISECVHRNYKSEFAQWSDEKVDKVLHRAGQIARKYAVKAYSISVDKDDYDAAVPQDIREIAGLYHYTWAVRHLLRWIDRWGTESKYHLPFEYVYDTMSKGDAKTEIISVMEQIEYTATQLGQPGLYINWSFRRRQDVPALQCSDLVAWACYQESLWVYRDTPLGKHANKLWNYLYGPTEDWLRAKKIKRQALRTWVSTKARDEETLKPLREWAEIKKREKQSRIHKVRQHNGAAVEGSTCGNKGQIGRRERGKGKKAEG